MVKLIVIGLLVILSIQVLYAQDVDDGDNDDFELSDQAMDRREAAQFVRKIYNPFGSRNEEIKREVTERYEEKCESIIPFKRHCPELKYWKEFRAYENGE